MSLRSGLQLVSYAAQFVASPDDSEGPSPIVESPANSNQGTQVDAWLVANGQASGERWEMAFVVAVYKALNFRIEIAGETPEEGWRSGLTQNLVTPTPIKGCLAFQVRMGPDGLLDVLNPYASSKVGIFCRMAESERQALIIGGNVPLIEGGNDGVVMKFYDVETPVPAEPTVKLVFIAPTLLHHGSGVA